MGQISLLSEIIMYHQIVDTINGFFQKLKKLTKNIIDDHYKILGSNL